MPLNGNGIHPLLSAPWTRRFNNGEFSMTLIMMGGVIFGCL
jgi:hypothetical protein